MNLHAESKLSPTRVALLRYGAVSIVVLLLVSFWQLQVVRSEYSSRVDTDHARARLLLVFVFYHLHQFFYAGSQRLLLDQPAPFISLAGLEAALVNSLLGMLAFHFLDRFRRTL